MNPAPPDPAEVLPRVRQQLILAQVRIMELEDARDETAARLDETNRLLHGAQSLADQKLAETAHAERLRADSETQLAQLQRLQQAITQSLEVAQAQLAEIQQKLEAQLREAAAREQRLAQIDADVRAVKASRSWRWTAWLRAVERLFSGGKS